MAQKKASDLSDEELLAQLNDSYMQGARLPDATPTMGAPSITQGPRAGRTIPIGGADPAKPFVAPKAQADLRKTEGEIANDRTRLLYDMAKAGYMLDAKGNVVRDPTFKPQPQSAPQLTAQERADALDMYNSALALDPTIRTLEQRFKAGPGKHSGLAGVLDWLPTEANQAFYNTTGQLRGSIKKAQGLTGTESNTVGEQVLNYGPFIPDRSDYDENARKKLQDMRRLQQETIAKSIAKLGGIPDRYGNIQPVPQNALNQPYAVRSSPQAAGFGADKARKPIPPEMQSEFEGWFANNTLGNINPDAYAKFRAGLDDKYGMGKANEAKLQEYRDEANTLNDTARRGGTIDMRIPGPEYDMSTTEFLRNSAVNNPVGAAAAGYLNMAGFGVPEYLARQKMEALGQAQPLGMALGQIGGAISGTAALRKLGGMGVRRLPSQVSALTSKLSPAARNIAADTAYSAAYGAGSGQDPLASAGYGAVGSAGGNVAGKVIGGAARGIAAPLASALRDRGVPLTVGQLMRETGPVGRFVSGIENRMSGFAGAGDTVNSRYAESFSGFNKAALDEALAPVGGKASGVGEVGVERAKARVSQAYERALRGKSIPIDPQSATITALMQKAKAVPNVGDSVVYQMERALNYIENGQLSGKGYQKARHVLDKAAAKLLKADALEGEEGADLLREMIDELDNTAINSVSPGIATNLRKANEAWRKVNIVQEATAKAAVGSQSGTPGIPTVAQLIQAAERNAKKYGGSGTTKRPFYDLTQAGQQVLPNKVPDSGTAGRVAMLAGAGGLLGGGYGALTSEDPTQGAATGAGGGALSGAALTALLMAGGSRGVQNAAVRGLTDRTATLKRIGDLIDKRKRLLGTAALPLFIQ